MPAASVGGRMTMVWHAVTASAASTTRAKGMFDAHRMVKVLSISCRGAGNALRRRIFEMQRLAGMDERIDGMRRHRRLGEAREDELELVGIGGDIADREDASRRGCRGRRIDRNVGALED